MLKKGIAALCMLVFVPMVLLKSYILVSTTNFDSLYSIEYNKQDKITSQVSIGQKDLETSTTMFKEWKENSLIKSSKNILESTTKFYETQLYSQKRLKHALLKASKETITILLWKKSHFKENMKIDDKQCGSCVLSYNESKIKESTTKSVLFVYPKAEIRKLPKYRRPDQFYVWLTHESARYVSLVKNKTFQDVDNLFNLTMTYRRYADIYFPWGTAASTLQYLNDLGTGDPVKDIDIAMSKKKHIALWVVSNCDKTVGARLRKALTDDLIKEGLPIDRRGRCFEQNLPFPDDEQEQIELIESFKFYIAFENNEHCGDYITEKFWSKALRRGVVPIVWGSDKADYLKVAPPHSFIHVNDFATTKDLIDFVNYLDKNNTAYREYLNWRLTDEKELLDYGRTIGMCQLCRVLHGINVDNVFSPRYNETKQNVPLFGYAKTPRTVPSIRKWFYEKENRECLPKY